MVPSVGVANPAGGGTSAVTVVLPVLFLSGVKVVVAVSSPPLKITGETTVPTVGVELVTGTDAVVPPRTGWISAKCSDESSRTEFSVNVVPVAP